MLQRFLTILLLFLFAISSLAQDDSGNVNDPAENERANACYSDGEMADKCDTEWEWICGWYMIRYDNGLLSREQIPSTCLILLPTLVDVVFEGGAPANCLDSSTAGLPDISFDLPEAVKNGVIWSSTDGSCSGSFVDNATIVLVGDVNDAENKCNLLLGSMIHHWLVASGYPAGYANCGVLGP